MRRIGLAIPAVDVFHRIKKQTVIAAGFQEVNDVRMIELPQSLDFAVETGHENIVPRQVGIEDFDRDDDGRVVSPMSAMDRAHRPTADLRVDHPRSEPAAGHANPPGTSISHGRPMSHTMTPMPDQTTALLLIAHGSREPSANEDLFRLADELAATRQYATVVAAFLELAEPDIDAGGEKCVETKPDRVVLIPYFLSAGVHVRRDLAAVRDRLAERFPSIEFRLAEPLGPHPLLMEIVVQRANNCIV